MGVVHKKTHGAVGAQGKEHTPLTNLKKHVCEKKHRGWEEENVFFFLVDKVLELLPQYQPVGGSFD